MLTRKWYQRRKITEKPSLTDKIRNKWCAHARSEYWKS